MSFKLKKDKSIQEQLEEYSTITHNSRNDHSHLIKNIHSQNDNNNSLAYQRAARKDNNAKKGHYFEEIDIKYLQRQKSENKQNDKTEQQHIIYPNQNRGQHIPTDPEKQAFNSIFNLKQIYLNSKEIPDTLISKRVDDNKKLRVERNRRVFSLTNSKEANRNNFFIKGISQMDSTADKTINKDTNLQEKNNHNQQKIFDSSQNYDDDIAKRTSETSSNDTQLMKINTLSSHKPLFTNNTLNEEDASIILINEPSLFEVSKEEAKSSPLNSKLIKFQEEKEKGKAPTYFQQLQWKRRFPLEYFRNSSVGTQQNYLLPQTSPSPPIIEPSSLIKWNLKRKAKSNLRQQSILKQRKTNQYSSEISYNFSLQDPSNTDKLKNQTNQEAYQLQKKSKKQQDGNSLSSYSTHQSGRDSSLTHSRNHKNRKYNTMETILHSNIDTVYASGQNFSKVRKEGSLDEAKGSKTISDQSTEIQINSVSFLHKAHEKMNLDTKDSQIMKIVSQEKHSREDKYAVPYKQIEGKKIKEKNVRNSSPYQTLQNKIQMINHEYNLSAIGEALKKSRVNYTYQSINSKIQSLKKDKLNKQDSSLSSNKEGDPQPKNMITISSLVPQNQDQFNSYLNTFLKPQQNDQSQSNSLASSVRYGQAAIQQSRQLKMIKNNLLLKYNNNQNGLIKNDEMKIISQLSEGEQIQDKIKAEDNLNQAHNGQDTEESANKHPKQGNQQLAKSQYSSRSNNSKEDLEIKQKQDKQTYSFYDNVTTTNQFNEQIREIISEKNESDISSSVGNNLVEEPCESSCDFNQNYAQIEREEINIECDSPKLSLRPINFKQEFVKQNTSIHRLDQKSFQNDLQDNEIMNSFDQVNNHNNDNDINDELQCESPSENKLIFKKLIQISQQKDNPLKRSIRYDSFPIKENNFS